MAMKKIQIQNDSCCQSSAQYGQTEPINYGYYSRVLKKPFDTLEELRKEEQEFLVAEEAKRQAAEARKQKASTVETAFKALNAAKHQYNEEVTAAYSELVKNIDAAKQLYQSVVNQSNAKLDKAQTTYNEALNVFIEEHPEGYHLTLKDGDNVVTIRSNNASEAITGKDFNKDFFDTFFKLFK